ncbi:NADPH-dependent 1-acyl dihydroxyacetone phosphate reductase [Recurvomyces mirabilis]|uniref:NADPH-dependent 1-acyl dihydroxyacetone phosphate reductase n=1 Tax=Recurvomyces mirabilis TaxID=574656 RepID=A0AAE0WIE3_9PEZI|nr:NADPH-dependent 1-acyl dihydroxyacetone phosphate reductase [Recurvomyces mirabilis]KAK5160351.1 hypothetical protein LTS14_001363 [Recurvomyces mirabilis]
MSKMKVLESSGIECLQLDVANADSITKVIQFLERACLGKLDILVNNAGLWLETPALDIEMSMIKAMFEVNVFGPMEMVRQCTPLLFKAKGSIVNISSILAIMPYPMTSAYNASKAALAQYSETLRLELEPLDIRVLTIMSGQVSNNLVRAPRLNEGSIYKSLEPMLVQRARGYAGPLKSWVIAYAMSG